MKSRTFWSKFWSDGYVLDLRADEKLVFLYLLLNEKVSMSGIYEIHDTYITMWTGIDKTRINEIKNKLAADKKILFDGHWVYILNNHKYNVYTSQPRVLTFFMREFNQIPAIVRKHFLLDTGIKYQFPFKQQHFVFRRNTDIDLEVDIDIDIDRIGYQWVGNPSNTEKVDPNSIPDLDEWNKKNGAKSKIVSGFAVLLLTLLFGVFCIKPIHATTITHKVIVSQSVARSSVELKSPIPVKTATSTRSEGEPTTRGGVSSSSTTQHAYSPRPVVEGGAQ